MTPFHWFLTLLIVLGPFAAVLPQAAVAWLVNGPLRPAGRPPVFVAYSRTAVAW